MDLTFRSVSGAVVLVAVNSVSIAQAPQSDFDASDL